MIAAEKDTSINHLFLPLKPWLDDPNITEIAINRPCEIWIEKNNHWTRVNEPILTFNYLRSMSTAVASFTQNHIDATQPILSATLPQGERIQFVMPPACEAETISVTIRKPNAFARVLNDYVNDGYFAHVRPVTDGYSDQDRTLLTLKNSGDIHGFLVNAIMMEKVIVVAGATGSGKTTFMKAMLEHIPSHQRLITIEDVPELGLPNHPNHVRLFYPSEAAPTEPVTSAKLLKSCLRMKPDRILLAELRGAETFDFVNVCASGHGGSITSCHASSAAMTFERLALMTMQNPQGQTLPYAVIKKLLYQVIDVVIHVDNDVHSSEALGRHITEVWFEPTQREAK